MIDFIWALNDKTYASSENTIDPAIIIYFIITFIHPEWDVYPNSRRTVKSGIFLPKTCPLRSPIVKLINALKITSPLMGIYC